MAKGILVAEARQPSFAELREMFLNQGKDGPPSFIPPDLSPDDPKFPHYERAAQSLMEAFEGTRNIICVAATGRRYPDLEQPAKMILQSTKAGSSFKLYLKAFLALVSIHTFATPRQFDPEKRPILRLTEEFWAKEWVPRVFEKLREFDAKHKNSNLIAKVYAAMTKGATDAFISKKTKGHDIITYIAMNAPRWKEEKKSMTDIAEELVSEGFNITDSVFENVHKDIGRYGQYSVFFDRGDRK